MELPLSRKNVFFSLLKWLLFWLLRGSQMNIKRLDPLGIIAGVIKDLGLIEAIAGMDYQWARFFG
jgi:hypothetical protein